jgi:dienelactone hydrolase
MVAGARGRTARAVVVKYKGAHHFFDRENLQLRERRGVAFSADGSGRVTIGTNQEARADAIKRIPEWFAR